MVGHEMTETIRTLFAIAFDRGADRVGDPIDFELQLTVVSDVSIVRYRYDDFPLRRIILLRQRQFAWIPAIIAEVLVRAFRRPDASQFGSDIAGERSSHLAIGVSSRDPFEFG